MVYGFVTVDALVYVDIDKQGTTMTNPNLLEIKNEKNIYLGFSYSKIMAYFEALL